jgi:hypothetical protein
MTDRPTRIQRLAAALNDLCHGEGFNERKGFDPTRPQDPRRDPYYHLYAMPRGRLAHVVTAPDGPDRPLIRALCGAPGSDERAEKSGGWGPVTKAKGTCPTCLARWERMTRGASLPDPGFPE